MTCPRVKSVFALIAALASGLSLVVAAAEPPHTKPMRGPLDVHAVWVGEVVDTLDLSDDLRAEVARIIDEGHAAWRKWFEANHERVAAHTQAVRDARASGDKTQLKESMKKKKAFMHTAPSIFRHPEPVRNALPEPLRAAFDTRLQEKIKQVHQPRPATTDR